jgi:hypothetical protein
MLLSLIILLQSLCYQIVLNIEHTNYCTNYTYLSHADSTNTYHYHSKCLNKLLIYNMYPNNKDTCIADVIDYEEELHEVCADEYGFIWIDSECKQ